ncbi:efflux RND transporter periplasmic adaptor subunit [Actinophytocola sp. KF-1]
MKRLVVAAVLVAAAGSAVVTFADASPSPRYRLSTVTTGDVTQTVTVTGTVDHVNRADVAFGTDGTVKTLAVSPGDEVTAGQELGTLDTTDLQAAVDRASAQVTAAEAALAEDEAAQEEAAGRSDELASNQHKVRTARTTATKALTTAANALAAQEKACAAPTSPTCTAAVTTTRAAQEAVQRAQTTLQSAIEALAGSVPTEPESASAVAEGQASVDEATAKLVEAEQALAGATLRAPIAGTVGAVTATAGDKVGAGTPVVTLIGKGAATVTATVPLEQLQTLATGQTANVTPTGTTTDVPGTVTEVGTLPDESSETVTYPVTITVATPPAQMATGSTATATITVATAKDVLTVPTSAVRQGMVTVLSGDQTTPTRVTVGAVGPTRTEIKEGLAKGDQVVLANLDTPLPTNDQHPGPGGDFLGGDGPVRMMRPEN